MEVGRGVGGGTLGMGVGMTESVGSAEGSGVGAYDGKTVGAAESDGAGVVPGRVGFTDAVGMGGDHAASERRDAAAFVVVAFGGGPLVETPASPTCAAASSSKVSSKASSTRYASEARPAGLRALADAFLAPANATVEFAVAFARCQS